jgi:hypothetical protein
MPLVKLFERFLVTRSRGSTNVNGVVPMRSRRNAGLQLDCALSTFAAFSRPLSSNPGEGYPSAACPRRLAA